MAINQRVVASFIAVLLAGIAHAEPARDGVLDKTFGDGGLVQLAPFGTAGDRFRFARDLLVQPDGKIVVAGFARPGSGSVAERPAIVRLMPDGSPDVGFGEGGLFMLSGSALPEPQSGRLKSITMLPDGRLVGVGSRYRFVSFPPFETCLLVFAVSPNGQLDNGYGPAPGPACLQLGPAFQSNFNYEEFGSVVSLGDGRVAVLGLADISVSTGTAIARLDNQGRVDVAYGVGGFAYSRTDYAFGPGAQPALLLAPGATFVVAGSRSAPRNSGLGMFRLQDSGALDMAFGVAGFAGSQIGTGFQVQSSISIDSMGRLLSTFVYRDTASTAGVYCDYCVARFTGSGQPDLSFNNQGAMTGSPGRIEFRWSENSNFYPVEILSRADGRTVVVGTAGSADNDFGLISIAHDGAPDSRFGDPARPGTLSLDLGTATGGAEIPTAAVLDNLDRVLVGGYCAGDCLIRLIDDQVFVDEYE